MTAYRLQSRTSCIRYQSVNGSTSRRVLVYNCLHNISPSYLSSMCQPVSVNPGHRCLWSAARGDLVVPATRTICYGPRSFAVAGLATWNSLPTSLRDDQLTVCRCISPSSQDWTFQQSIRLFFSMLVTVFTVRVSGEHILTTTMTTNRNWVPVQTC